MRRALWTSTGSRTTSVSGLVTRYRQATSIGVGQHGRVDEMLSEHLGGLVLGDLGVQADVLNAVKGNDQREIARSVVLGRPSNGRPFHTLWFPEQMSTLGEPVVQRVSPVSVSSHEQDLIIADASEPGPP